MCAGLPSAGACAFTHQGRLKPCGGVPIWVQVKASSDSNRFCGPAITKSTFASEGEAVMAWVATLTPQPGPSAVPQLVPPLLERWCPSDPHTSTIVFPPLSWAKTVKVARLPGLGDTKVQVAPRSWLTPTPQSVPTKTSLVPAAKAIPQAPNCGAHPGTVRVGSPVGGRFQLAPPFMLRQIPPW